MNTFFNTKLITLITLSFFTNVACAINFKTDLTKKSNSAALPTWQQPHLPDYAAELQKYKPSKKEPDNQRAKELMANAKQNVNFLENKGQMMDTEGKPVPFVLFKAEAPGMNVYITEKGLTYVFVKIEEDEDEEKEERNPSKHKDLMLPGKHDEKLKAEMAWINVNLKGATIKRENIIKEQQSTEHFNYFYGHCPEGIYNVYQYKKLTIKNVYPNIDWVFYNSQKGGMKYDFIVHPGANPNDIKLIYESEKPIDLDKNGNLQLKTKLGNLTENAPYSYIKENNIEVKSSFKTTSINKNQVEVTFTLDQSTYAQNSTLVIDPQLVWGTFFGGQGAEGPQSIDTDLSGNLFVTGYVIIQTNGFPLQNTGTFFQGILSGLQENAFILKFSNNGNLIWGTYYGGSIVDIGNSISTDSNGNVFVAGTAGSADFPVQNSGTFFQGTLNGGSDAFILKFDNNGNCLWATYYGGSGGETVFSICIDSNGNVFVTGSTDSNNFPLQNAGSFFQPLLSGTQDAFILKFSNNGTRLGATYYGGTGIEEAQCICTDSNGNVFVSGYTQSTDFPVQNAGTFFQGSCAGGSDAFILKFDNNGNRLWASYYGGTGFDYGNSIYSDSNGNVFVTGLTLSTNFPVQNSGTFFQGAYGGGISDGFILKFDNTGNRLWATYFGGSSDERMFSNDNISIDNCDNIYLGFGTVDVSFPYLINASNCLYYDNSINGYDILIARFTNAGSLNYCTFIGGNGYDAGSAMAIDMNNNLFISWECNNVFSSLTYPLANPGAGAYFDNTYNGLFKDGYIIKLSPSPIQKQVAQQNSTNCQCNGSATFSITCGDAPYSYVWSNGQSVLNTTVTSHTITNLCDGVYNVTVTAGCTQTIVETYTISGTGGIVAQANVLPANTICAGQSLTLSTIAASTYTWAGPNNFIANTQNTAINNAQVTSSGVYTISIESGTGCSSTATVAVNVQAIEQPNVTFNYQSQYCKGDGIAKVSLSNGFNVGGIFSSDAGLIIDANTGDIDLSASTTGTYIVTYNIAAGLCKAAGSNTAQVIINKSPVALIQSNAVPACPPLCASYSFVPTADVASYSWLLPSSNTIANTPTVQTCYSSPGTYTLQLEVKGTNGCVAKGSYSIEVYPKPIADFVFNPTNPTLNDDDMVTFKDATGYGSPTQWAWHFLTETKNTITKFGNEATYKYTEAGTYPISLVVTNNYGCIDTVVKSIVVADDYGLFIPNAFTPNNDGVNDTFVPKGHGIKSYTLVIFDRWGEQLYKTNQFENGWDGYYKGVLSKSDIYTWKINCVDIKNKSHELIGSFTLLK